MQFTFGSGRSWVGVGEVDELAEEAKRVDGKWRWKIIPLQSALLAINEFLLTLIWFTFFFAFFFLLTRECLMIGIYEFNNRLWDGTVRGQGFVDVCLILFGFFRIWKLTNFIAKMCSVYIRVDRFLDFLLNFFDGVIWKCSFAFKELIFNRFQSNFKKVESNRAHKVIPTNLDIYDTWFRF